ncbi:MAG: HAMP domain-containing histidine kinase [Actinomycetia bacterium]|nr:HAMP domain-containing histidine kinase [Actinomycetes bacterium]
MAPSDLIVRRNRPDKPGGFSSRLGFAFALVAASTAILSGLIMFLVWNYQFNAYVRSNLESIAQTMADSASRAYETYGGWEFSAYAVIPQAGARSDINVQILDSRGTVVYDEAVLRQHMQQQGSMTGENPLATPLPSVGQPKGRIVSAPVVVAGLQRVGTVRVWAYGTGGLMSAHDISMRTSSMIALGLSACLAILIATLAGITWSRRLVRPINCITEAAASLRDGETSARTGLVGTDEISQLGETFDTMADSIEADRKLERQLTSDVAHELKTPLMGIQATAEAIEDGIFPADRAHLSIISHETQRLARLTNAILELSRLEAGSQPFQMKRIPADQPARAALDVHGQLIEGAGLHLLSEFDTGIYIYGDADRLQQAIGNFLSNAARYTPEGGTIMLRGEYDRKTRRYTISITDTGIGIKPEDLEKLFIRFWRADEARDRESGGAGVGLPIAKEIIDRHKGQIDVTSEVGKGTSISLILPTVK